MDNKCTKCTGNPVYFRKYSGERLCSECFSSSIIEKARRDGIIQVRGEYIKTEKNQPAENFFVDFGFKKEGGFWIFNTKDQFKKPEHLVIS